MRWLALSFVGWTVACHDDPREPLDPPDRPASPDVASGPTADEPVGLRATASRLEVVSVMERINGAFMARWPSPGADIVINRKTVPSNTWSRAVYFEGLMALADERPEPAYRDYAMAWGESHAWGLRSGRTTRFADDQCAGQTYLDLYERAGHPARIADIEASVDEMVAGVGHADWTWIDAIQMAMPVFARLGVRRRDARVLEKMHALYTYARDEVGPGGLYNRSDHLWWRDANYTPPYAEPNGSSCYWSRGNGWVLAGLARVLDVLPEGAPHREEYLADFTAMADALRSVRRADGFWNVSLHDPTHFGGKELTGTALFVYGMAWGVRRGVLSEAVYLPLVTQSWKAMVGAVHPDGRLGWVQGTAARPADGQPVTYDSEPNIDDFAVGAFLLAGGEMARIASR